MSESEQRFAFRLANTVLDDVTRDPDSDLSVLARQFLRALERGQWQPIETAPNAGVFIAARREFGGSIPVVLVYRNVSSGFNDCAVPFTNYSDLTNWLPLPEPPK